MHVQAVFDCGSGFRVQGLKTGQNKKRYKARPSEIRSDKLNTRCCDFVNLTRQAAVNMPQLNRKDRFNPDEMAFRFNRASCH